MKKIVNTFLCALLLAMLSVHAHAQSDSSLYVRYTEYQEDGSYFIIEISQTNTEVRANTTSGTKSATYYDEFDTPIYAVDVTGSFSYNGTSATADSATSTVYIYDRNASFDSKGAYTSGASAVGYANIKFNSRPIYKSVVLTCSKDGKLS